MSGHASTAALALRDVTVTRGGREVLRVGSLRLEPGETLAVLGPNGAGKSTLLLASALLIPARGEIELFGERAGRGSRVRLRRQTSTVFQDSALLDMSAQRNVEEALSIHGVPRGERRARAGNWLNRLGVSGRAGARPHALSGGEAQRVSLARALAVEPRLVFLDEPFTGLDFPTRSRMVGEMRALLAETGVAALLATHDHAEAAVLADRVVVVVDGGVAQEGTAAEVMRRPASAAVAGFLGFALCEAEGAARALGVARPSGATLAAVPPAAVAVGNGGPGASITASIAAIEGAAGGVRLVLDGGLALVAETTVDRLHDERWRVGAPLPVTVDLDRVVWL